jgi:hypothetical protein
MNRTEFDGDRFRSESEFRRVRMSHDTMRLASELQDLFRSKGDVPTSLEFVVECAINLLHEDLLR